MASAFCSQRTKLRVGTYTLGRRRANCEARYALRAGRGWGPARRGLSEGPRLHREKGDEMIIGRVAKKFKWSF